jgi:hypothetical protein
MYDQLLLLLAVLCMCLVCVAAALLCAKDVR